MSGHIYYAMQARIMELRADAFDLQAEAARFDPHEPEKAEAREREACELAASYRANARTYRKMAERAVALSPASDLAAQCGE